MRMTQKPLFSKVGKIVGVAKYLSNIRTNIIYQSFWVWLIEMMLIILGLGKDDRNEGIGLL